MLLHEFLSTNREDLIDTCRVKVAARRAPRPTEAELEHGIPLFLEQLIEMLKDQNPASPQPMVSTAKQHGAELLDKGFTVAQVIHDYGDLCQAITELAADEDAPITPREFGALNRSLDDAIAAAVTEHARQREETIKEEESEDADLRSAFLAHELRNALNTALLSFEVLKRGSVAINGATGAVHDRSLKRVRTLVDDALAEVRLDAGARIEEIEIRRFIEEVEIAAMLEADALTVGLTIVPVDPDLTVRGDPQILAAVLANLLQNALKFTRENGGHEVTLRVRHDDDSVFFDVEDECGGLPPGKAEELLRPFEQRGADRSGLGVGLTICHRGVEANDGKLHVRNIPDKGCVFTVELSRDPDGRDGRRRAQRVQQA